MDNQNRNLLIVGALILAVILLGPRLGLFSITQVEYGYEFYGESPNQITGIGNACSSTNYDTIITSSSGGVQENTRNCNGNYWNIETYDYSAWTGSSMSVTGNDFEMKANFGGGSGSTAKATFITTEDFSERDFKVNLFVPSYSIGGTPNPGASVSLYLYSSAEEKSLVSFSSNGIDKNVVISPSVISNKVFLYVNGEKIETFDLSENLNDYKIKIVFSPKSGWSGGSSLATPDLTISDFSYRQQFGCTTEPDEQTYVVVFNEGDRINLNKLEEFTKFCLAESPAKIYTNIGSTTNTEVLERLINGEEINVPTGQIWSIEYIGKKTTFKTDCEEDELFLINEDICLARAVVSLVCPTDSSFDFSRGICTVETEPSPYVFPSIQTHQDLEPINKFLFTHILDNYDEYSQSSFKIGSDTFISNGLIYNGFLTGSIDFDDDPNNWIVSFNFDGKNYEGKVGEEFVLDNFVKVKISDIEVYKRDSGIKRFGIYYTFSINTDFLKTSYSSGKVSVLNSYQSFDGGLVVTKTNNIGTTTVETIDKKLRKGTTSFDINIINILELKVRPFITIETPQYIYNFDAKEAIVIDLREIVRLTATIQEQIDMINSLQATINEKADLINGLNLNLQEQSILIANLELTSQEKAQIISQLELNLQEQAELISEMSLTSNQQLEIIDGLNLNIQEQAELINSLKINLQQKAFLISQLQVTNEEQASLIAQMELSFSDQAEIIEALENLIGGDATIIQSLYDNIDEQAKLISELEYTNQELSDLITEMELTTLEQAELINLLKLSIDEQLIIIGELGLSLEEEQELVNKLNLTLKEQQKLIEDLKDYEPNKFDFTDFFEQYKIAIFIIGGFLFLIIISGGRKK